MSSNIPKKNRIDQAAAHQALIDGLNKHQAAIAGIPVEGSTPRDVKSVIAEFQANIDVGKASQSARATWHAAVKADAEQRANSAALVSATRQWLLVNFAGQVETLADFGLTPRRKASVTPQAKVAAVAKAKATRAARHTMGSKQKAAIKGTVPTDSTAIPPAPSTPAPAPATSVASTAPPAVPAPAPSLVVTPTK
jgi:hypothetical protein